MIPDIPRLALVSSFEWLFLFNGSESCVMGEIDRWWKTTFLSEMARRVKHYTKLFYISPGIFGHGLFRFVYLVIWLSVLQVHKQKFPPKLLSLLLCCELRREQMLSHVTVGSHDKGCLLFLPEALFLEITYLGSGKIRGSNHHKRCVGG